MTYSNLHPGTYTFLQKKREENYIKNIKLNNKLMKQLGWDDLTAISYNINLQGFRSDFDFNTYDECNLYLGCSYTLGEEMPVNLIWPSLVNNFLNDYKLYNLGILNASVSTCYRILKDYINVYNVKRVFILYPYYSRKEFFYKEKIETYSMHKNPFDDNTAVLSIFNDSMLKIEKSIIIDAIRYTCLSRNIPLYELDIDSKEIEDFYIKDRTARDLRHFGKKTHKFIADTFIKMNLQ